MRILFEYTKRILMKNRARTLVTIVGIVLSFALFTAVLTGMSSGIRFLIRMAEAGYGNWHGLVYHTNTEEQEKINQLEGVTDIFSMQNQGVARIPEEEHNQIRPYVVLCGIDETFTNAMHINLIDGKMPEKDGEIIVPDNLYQTGVRLNTGDTITLEIGNRQYLDGTPIYHNEPYRLEQETLVITSEKTFTVVGVYEKKYISFESACRHFYTIKQDNDTMEKDVFFRTTSLNGFETRLQELFPQHQIKTNTYLLQYLGYGVNANTQKVIYGFVAILCCLVVLVSVSLIYNAFAISLGERTKQFGLLKSIGTTKSQIRWMVWIEAGILCIVAIPMGLFIGCGSVWIVLKVLRKQFLVLTTDIGASVDIIFHTEPVFLVVAVFLGIVTVFISAFIPAFRANQMTPIEAIRQVKDVKLSAKQVRGGKLWQKLLGVSGLLAYKNTKRNKKPYGGIIFSIVSSLVLFLAGGGLVSYMKEFAMYELQHIDYNFIVSYEGVLSNEEQDKISSYLEEQESIDDFVIIRSQQLMLDFGSKDVFTEIGQIYMDKRGNSVLKAQNHVPIQVCYLDNDSYFDLLEQNGLERYYDCEQPVAIAVNYLQGTAWNNAGEQYSYAGTLYKNQNDLSQMSLWIIQNIGGYVAWYETQNALAFYDANNVVTEHTLEEVRQDVEVSIGAMLPKEKVPSYISTHLPTILLPMKWIQDAGMLNTYLSNHSFLYVYTTESEQAWMDVTAMQRGDFPLYSGITDMAASANTSKAMLAIINVFLFCFVIVLCIIAVANIGNTIATSVRLRTREYAMLQSIGMGSKSMNRYILFENLSYTVKAGIIGFGLSIEINYMTLEMMQETLAVPFFLPMTYYGVALVALVVLVCFSVMYTNYKTKGTHICDELKNENW